MNINILKKYDSIKFALKLANQIEEQNPCIRFNLSDDNLNKLIDKINNGSENVFRRIKVYSDDFRENPSVQNEIIANAVAASIVSAAMVAKVVIAMYDVNMNIMHHGYHSLKDVGYSYDSSLSFFPEHFEGAFVIEVDGNNPNKDAEYQRLLENISYIEVYFELNFDSNNMNDWLSLDSLYDQCTANVFIERFDENDEQTSIGSRHEVKINDIPEWIIKKLNDYFDNKYFI